MITCPVCDGKDIHLMEFGMKNVSDEGAKSRRKWRWIKDLGTSGVDYDWYYYDNDKSSFACWWKGSRLNDPAQNLL